jgi:protein TonB
MLDQLVESKSNSKDNKRRSEFIVTVLVIMVVGLISSWTYSLFAKDFGMGSDDLALTTLVAPVPVPDEAPPEKQPEKPQQKQPDVDVRKDLIQNMDMSPKIPDKISTEQNKVKAIRDDRYTKIGNEDLNTGAKIDPGVARQVDSGSTAGLNSTSTGTAPTGGDEPPPPPKAKPSPPPAPKTVSGGVLNGKATSLPKPPYPPAARAVRAGGAVSVQVLISESGSVISASAVSGHPLLRAAAEAAARGARFSPTMLSGQPVKVSGVITYNFVP